MKSASLPSLRVEPALRKAAEQVLREGESLSAFIESSLRLSIEQRCSQNEFISRGLASRDRARVTGKYEDARSVIDELSQMLAEEKQKRS
ncbi:MAG: prevent-host-death protein [Chlorobiales bacterium]|nr:prevent-host-death protein [Chlorobiales bacterium]